MAEPAPVITELRRVEGRPNPGATVVVARFTCRVGGMLLLGVKLTHRAGGTHAVSNVVVGGGPGSHPRGAVIEDPALRAAILVAAVAAYREAPEPDAADGLRRFLSTSTRSEPPRRHRGPRRQG